MTNYDKEFVELCKYRVPDTIKLFIEKGVDVNYNNDEAMLNACFYKNTTIIDILFETGKFTNLDYYLSESIRLGGGIKIVKQLIGYGAKFSKNNENIIYNLFNAEFKNSDLVYLFEETNMFEVLDPNKIFSEYFAYGEISRNDFLLFPLERIEKENLLKVMLSSPYIESLIFEDLMSLLEHDDLQLIFDSRFNYIAYNNGYNGLIKSIDKIIELGYEITDDNINNALTNINDANTFIMLIEKYCLFERAKELLGRRIVSSKDSVKRDKLMKYFDLTSE